MKQLPARFPAAKPAITPGKFGSAFTHFTTAEAVSALLPSPIGYKTFMTEAQLLTAFSGWAETDL